MNAKTLHDLKNTLHRLELMANLLEKKNFTDFSQEEIRKDVESDLENLSRLFRDLSSDQ